MSHRSLRAAAVVAGLLVVLLLLPSPAAASFNMSLDVAVIVDKPMASVGDTVHATAYVIWGGVLADAGYINLTMIVSGPTSWAGAVNVTRESTGVYGGAFQVPANMTPSAFSWITVRASATVGSLSTDGSVTVAIPGGLVLTDRAILSAYEAAPGQTVQGTIQTYLSGALTDVDNLTVQALLSVPGSPGSVAWPAVTNLSAGTYGFSYTVPSTLNESGAVSFFANAYVLALHTSFGLSNLPSLRIDVANPFLVWVHQVALAGGNATFEVWVADPVGSPVPGAAVWVTTYQPRLPWGGMAVSARAVTDLAGRASFHLVSLSNRPLTDLYLSGFVSRGSANESFTGYLTTPGAPTYGFTVQRDNVLDLFEPGETAFLNYTASYSGVPLAKTTILYTAYTPSTLVAYGRVTTDASGGFGLNLTMPADGVVIDFSTQTSAGVSAITGVGESAYERLHVDLSTLQVGSTGHVGFGLPASGGPWYVSIEFYPASTSGPADTAAGWEPWPELTGLGVRLGAQTVAGPAVNLSLPLPAFLPAGAYFLRIFAFNLAAVLPAGPFPIPYGYAAIVTVQPAPLGVGALLVLTVPMVLAVVVVLWVVLWRGKRGPPPVRAEPPAPPESKGTGP